MERKMEKKRIIWEFKCDEMSPSWIDGVVTEGNFYGEAKFGGGYHVSSSSPSREMKGILPFTEILAEARVISADWRNMSGTEIRTEEFIETKEVEYGTGREWKTL